MTTSNQNPKAILFDLDGTLLDTIEDIADSVNAALAAFGHPSHDLDFYKIAVGRGADNLVLQSLPPESRDPDTLQLCALRFLTEYEMRWDRKTHVYSGIPELLDALTARGLAMAILSNKPESFTKRSVDRFLSRWHFHAVIGANADFPQKPDAAAAIAIAGRMATAPSEFLYVGDTDTDMQTAVAAKMMPVGVLWGFREREELVSNGARVIINHPMELIKLIDR